MNRPVHGYPLAAFDPVWGDPGRVRAAGEEYLRVAATIAQAADDLRAIASEMDGTSAAVDEADARATRPSACGVPGRGGQGLGRAQGRYRPDSGGQRGRRPWGRGRRCVGRTEGRSERGGTDRGHRVGARARDAWVGLADTVAATLHRTGQAHERATGDAPAAPREPAG